MKVPDCLMRILHFEGKFSWSRKGRQKNITELWLDIEKLEFLSCTFFEGTPCLLRLTNSLKMAMEKRKAGLMGGTLKQCQPGAHGGFFFQSPGAALSTKLAIKNKAAEAREKAGMEG